MARIKGAKEEIKFSNLLKATMVQRANFSRLLNRQL